MQAYKDAQKNYHDELNQYWSGVSKSKQQHEVVKDFPPAYDGPKRPLGYETPHESKTLPSINTMLDDWKKFAPLAEGKPLPVLKIDETSEYAFKKAYAHEALIVGEKYGLKDKQTERIVEDIYTFEVGGIGKVDTLSGVSPNAVDGRNIHPASTAIGYNQLMPATSLSFVDGSQSVNKRLKALAAEEPSRSQEILEKNKIFSEVQHSLHEQLMKFAKTNSAKYLDADGKANYSLYCDFAKSEIPSSNGLTGREMASAIQALNMDKDIGPILQSLQLDDIFKHSLKNNTLQSALTEKFHGKADDFLPASVELANLAGTANAGEMLKPENADYPTVNFFNRQGYDANPVTHNRTADQLLRAIYKHMQPKAGRATQDGMKEMIAAFEDQ
jgi:hypothetical protein